MALFAIKVKNAFRKLAGSGYNRWIKPDFVGNAVKIPTKSLGIMVLFGLLMAGGCGQKGPLYLPDDQEQKATQQ